MNANILEKIGQENRRQGEALELNIGDSVRVHVHIKEGGKERVQVFSGVVIGRSGSGATETFTVRRVSFGEGVERVFPVHSPHVVKIEIEQRGRTRRAKLYYLRDRRGKAARVKQAK